MKHITLYVLLLALTGCADRHQHEGDEHEHEQGQEGHEQVEQGPHGGRILRADGFAVELAIFEQGVPPEYRAWLYRDGNVLPPTAAAVQVSVTRLDGRTRSYSLAPDGELLRGDGAVAEPHSFDVAVTAITQEGQKHEWTFAAYEGRTQIAEATATAMDVTVAEAGPAELLEQIELTGTVHADPTRISRVRARYPGVIREIAVQPFSTVSRGALLAQVQSNESLLNYPITAPIGGIIVEQQAQIGEATGDEALFTIVDITRVWVELDVFQRELGRIDEGQRVELMDLDGKSIATGHIGRIAPLAVHGSQSVRARVVIDNAAGQLRPGQFVTGHVTVGKSAVALAVEKQALQRFRDFDVVFAKVGNVYEVRMLELGRSDERYVEVLSGLEPGTLYVHANSYLIKADIEKAGAGHDH